MSDESKKQKEQDIVQVLRIVRYVGRRDEVEKQISNSLHGTRTNKSVSITAVTLTEFPEVLERDPHERVVELTATLYDMVNVNPKHSEEMSAQVKKARAILEKEY